MSTLPQAMTRHEQNQALVVELRNSRDRFLSLLESVTENLGDIRPADGDWSIMDCAEHICRAEELMSVSLSKEAPLIARPLTRREYVRNSWLKRQNS